MTDPTQAMPSILDDPKNDLALDLASSELPLVSVCTPTYNRRPFIEAAKKCFQRQTYPAEKLEWIVIDDGTDPVLDLLQNEPRVKYTRLHDKLSLGEKRNLMHRKAQGDIIVYMDDDDYYPPERVEHAVQSLIRGPYEMAGASVIYIWFHETEEMYCFGPYNPNHCTAGTFAFKKSWLKKHKYNDEKALAEEKDFLNDYKDPVYQLDPTKVILCISHSHNTFDKRKLLKNIEGNRTLKRSDLKPEDFIKDPEMLQFFTKDIHEQLENYKEGDIRNKPDVLRQLYEMTDKRFNDFQNMIQQQLTVTNSNNPNQRVTLSIPQLLEMLKQAQAQVAELAQQNNQFKQLNQMLVARLKAASGN